MTMNTVRASVGGKDGYSIYRVVEEDENGEIISSWYEVFDVDGNLVAKCESIGKAYSEIQRHMNNSGPAL